MMGRLSKLDTTASNKYVIDGARYNATEAARILGVPTYYVSRMVGREVPVRKISMFGKTKTTKKWEQELGAPPMFFSGKLTWADKIIEEYIKVYAQVTDRNTHCTYGDLIANAGSVELQDWLHQQSSQNTREVKEIMRDVSQSRKNFAKGYFARFLIEY